MKEELKIMAFLGFGGWSEIKIYPKSPIPDKFKQKTLIKMTPLTYINISPSFPPEIRGQIIGDEIVIGKDNPVEIESIKERISTTEWLVKADIVMGDNEQIKDIWVLLKFN